MFNYINFLLGEEAVASPSIGNNLWCIWTVFTHPAITPPEVNGFGWNLGQSEYIVWSWPWQIMGAIRAEERAGARAEILFFLSVSKARFHRLPVGQISRNSHTRRGSMSRWILSENVFENLPVRGLFSKKVRRCVNILNKFQLQAPISAKWIQIAESHDRLARLRNVGFPYVPLESTQSHSSGLQAEHTKRHFWTSLALPSLALHM